MKWGLLVGRGCGEQGAPTNLLIAGCGGAQEKSRNRIKRITSQGREACGVGLRA